VDERYDAAVKAFLEERCGCVRCKVLAVLRAVDEKKLGSGS
jgi:hypothetical protein